MHGARDQGLGAKGFGLLGPGRLTLPLAEAVGPQGEVLAMDIQDGMLVTVLGEIPGQVPALKELHSALKAGGILSVTEVIFDPHFQRHERVLRAAQAAGFREKNFFGRRLAYTLHLEKVVDA